MRNRPPKYKFYYQGNKIHAVSKYAGRMFVAQLLVMLMIILMPYLALNLLLDDVI